MEERLESDSLAGKAKQAAAKQKKAEAKQKKAASGVLRREAPVELSEGGLGRGRLTPQATGHAATGSELRRRYSAAAAAGAAQPTEAAPPHHRARATTQLGTLDADAKAIATLAYLHNGKLDYPSRILSYMQDPELHGLIYSSRRSQPYMLI